MRKVILTTLFCLLLAFAAAAQQAATPGELQAADANGEFLGFCPLKNTDVKIEVTGFLSRVRVFQEFENKFAEKIEAVYTFPLPNNAAVDDMTMRIGERTVRGQIRRREEAREIYEAAKSNGQTASLLDQERPNIFTQSVANILPGEKITIEISYVETLKYEDGSYELVFPMTIGPRYAPGSISAAEARKITPPVARRAGHDISIEVDLDAGVVVEKIESKSHEIDSTMRSANSYGVRLKNEKTIPNKDFVLRYDVAGKRIGDAVLTHRSAKGGYFTLILQPPDEPRVEDVTPKEIVFVLDTSGSMEGFPIEKAKESMRLALDGLNPQDTFNLITFAGDTHVLFEKPVPATPENLKLAQGFLAARKGAGGTEMMKAIRAALAPTDSQQHIRVVCFMTDGYVGNESEILAEIQRHPNARIFGFGIGNSVNRALLDKMAEEGRGEVEYVSLQDDGSRAARKFHERVRSPLLTDVSVDFGDLPVADVYPKRVNDLFSAKPVIIHGRFTGAAKGTIRLRGKSLGRETAREIAVDFPDSESRHDVLATLWARTRIDDLTAQDYENKKPEIKEQITNLGLEYRLMTAFTSFVAVEERVVTDGGQPRRIEVPVELPEGVSRDFVTVDALPTMSGAGLMATEVSITAASSPTINMQDSSVGTTFKPDAFALGLSRGGGSSSRKKDNSFVIDGQEATNFRTGALNGKNSLPLNGKAAKLPKPVFAPDFKWDGSDAQVNVRVTIDEAGSVTEAKAESGHASLRQAAEQAALQAKFKIEQAKENPVKITGVIAYNFALKGKKAQAEIGLRSFAVKLTPEEEKRRLIRSRTASAVFNLIERLKTGAAPSADEARFVRGGGKAEVLVRVRELNSATVEALKKLGFEVITEIGSAKAVVGRIAVEKLAALAETEGVTYISPQNR